MVCFLRLFSRTITPNDALRGSADECPARAHGAEQLPYSVRSIHGETNHAQTRSSF
jgi:hypothetical protein